MMSIEARRVVVVVVVTASAAKRTQKNQRVKLVWELKRQPAQTSQRVP
jgi:hypothetical protein